MTFKHHTIYMKLTYIQRIARVLYTKIMDKIMVTITHTMHNVSSI